MGAVSTRELVVLGTASQVPTRRRNHHGALLRWDGEGILLDPGEGTQRQMAVAGVPVGRVTRICITHFHGDHCLGLPGIVQRLSLDGITRPVPIHHPASGREHLDRLRHASVFDDRADTPYRPVTRSGAIDESGPLVVSARLLDHPVEAWGYRFEERPGRTLLPDRLAAAGIEGPAVGELLREGRLRDSGGRTVSVEDVSVERPGQAAAFVMDTRRCEGALELAAGVDLLVCESTFLEAEADRAEETGHLTARQAAEIAREAGARRLVLTHFSSRYPDEQAFLAEARPVHPDVVAAREALRVPVPRRVRGRTTGAVGRG